MRQTRVSLLCFIQEIANSGYYECPTVDCADHYLKPDDLSRHLRTEKSVVVRRPVKTEEEKAAEQKLRGELTCNICHVRCTSQNTFDQHLKGKRHKLTVFRQTYRENR